MDRRSALGLAALLPAALTARPASACSIAVESAETYTERLPQIARLFEAWFRRDELGFLGPLVGPLNTNGIEPDEATVRRYIEIADDSGPKELFGRFFIAQNAYPRIRAMTAIGETVFVAVNEQPGGGIGPDCSGMPTLHQFLVRYRFGRPRAVEHLGSEIWSGYGQVANWAGQ